jgi:hypothetical protein
MPEPQTYDSRMTSQRSYYLSEINRAIPSSRAVDTPTIATALGTVDPGLPNFNMNFDPTQFTSTFTSSSNAIQKDSECRNQVTPTLGMRSADARTGCGWWYINNPDLQSVGAYGSRRGPMNPTLDTKYGSGEWIWNLKEAGEREAIKAGRKITSCAAIAHSTFPNMGWCMSSNRAVATDGNGAPAYPSNPLGACSGQIITDSTQCSAAIAAAAAAAAAATPTGAAGGSPLPAAATCTDGNLSPGCLKSIVTAQCNATGSLAMALNNGYARTSQQAGDMNSVLLERNLSLPAGILADGRMTQAEAVSAVTQLKGWGTNANFRTAGAANNLCYGAPFDMCGVTNTTQKPFSATCISRAAQAAGWSPNGAAMPARNTNMSEWAALNTWGEVLNQITTWKQKADNPGTDQLEYIRKVYGMAATYPDHCPSVILGEHCGPNAGWQQTLPGAGTFMSGTDYKADASYITVPRGATAEVTNTAGAVQTIVGPGEFNFCSRGGFNDSTRQILVYITGSRATGCEGESANISCSAGTIQGVNVKYGKWIPGTCPGANSGTSAQQFYNKRFTPASCVGKSSCTIPIDNSLGGDPMGGTRKHWVATPECGYTPANTPLSRFQSMFVKAGCTRTLEESQVDWWRKNLTTAAQVQNDMNEYGRLTANCSGRADQHNFCSPGKCP